MDATEAFQTFSSSVRSPPRALVIGVVAVCAM